MHRWLARHRKSIGISMQILRHPLVIAALALLALPHVVTGTGFTWGIATEIAIFALVGLG